MGEGIADRKNCISYADFCEVCKQLISPMEIIDYFCWRREKMKDNPQIDLMVYSGEDGISLSRPMEAESGI